MLRRLGEARLCDTDLFKVVAKKSTSRFGASRGGSPLSESDISGGRAKNTSPSSTMLLTFHPKATPQVSNPSLSRRHTFKLPRRGSETQLAAPGCPVTCRGRGSPEQRQLSSPSTAADQDATPNQIGSQNLTHEHLQAYENSCSTISAAAEASRFGGWKDCGRRIQRCSRMGKTRAMRYRSKLVADSISSPARDGL